MPSPSPHKAETSVFQPCRLGASLICPYQPAITPARGPLIGLNDIYQIRPTLQTLAFDPELYRGMIQSPCFRPARRRLRPELGPDASRSWALVCMLRALCLANCATSLILIEAPREKCLTEIFRKVVYFLHCQSLT